MSPDWAFTETVFCLLRPLGLVSSIRNNSCKKSSGGRALRASFVMSSRWLGGQERDASTSSLNHSSGKLLRRISLYLHKRMACQVPARSTAPIKPLHKATRSSWCLMASSMAFVMSSGVINHTVLRDRQWLVCL